MNVTISILLFFNRFVSRYCLADGFNIDPTTTANTSFYKFREYILLLSAWCMVLASLDRLISSSPDVNRR
ncbi:unnamed protein product [Adineta steineri]|uniref:Uncharacterized protein n=1 Tax=Adineta steineri TaxID=433720 RepID=A0A814Z5U6_9BILA|nr:unnamed protein product [Adineta steineri]CAF1237553.1 unnamed protein product [Adineta steineri]